MQLVLNYKILIIINQEIHQHKQHHHKNVVNYAFLIQHVIIGHFMIINVISKRQMQAKQLVMVELVDNVPIRI